MSNSRKSVLEIDKMMGAEFPPGVNSMAAVVWDDESHTLSDIYSKAGITLEIKVGDENIPNLGEGYTERELIALMTTNSSRGRSGNEAGDMYAYLLIVNGLYDPEDLSNPGPTPDILGIMFSPRREGTAVFYKQPTIHDEPIAYLRTSAHEVGHQFNLHHRDGSVKTINGPQVQKKFTIMNQTGVIQKYGGWPNGISLGFGPLETSHLAEHPMETVAPGSSGLGDCTADHDGWHHDAPGRLGVNPTDLTSMDTLDNSDTPVLKPGKSEGVEFEMKMGKNEYLPGQPAIAYLRFTNKGSKPVSIVDRLDPRYDLVKFYIKKDEKETLFRPYSYIDFVPQERTLNSGESMYGRAKIFYGSRGYTFPEPGTYKVRASYHGITHGLGEIINSNIVDVVIKTPNGEEEEQVRLIKGDQQALFFLFEGGDTLTDGINQLTKLAEEYPNSTLGSYANAVLGLQWSRDFKDLQNNSIRETNSDKASTFLQTAKDNLKGYWADKTFLQLAEIQKKTGKESLGQQTLNEYVDKFQHDNRNARGIIRAKQILNEET